MRPVQNNYEEIPYGSKNLKPKCVVQEYVGDCGKKHCTSIVVLI